jgi:hypothetical protein
LRLHVVILTYECQQIVSGVHPPPRGGLTAFVIVMVPAQIHLEVITREKTSLPKKRERWTRFTPNLQLRCIRRMDHQNIS